MGDSEARVLIDSAIEKLRRTTISGKTYTGKPRPGLWRDGLADLDAAKQAIGGGVVSYPLRNAYRFGAVDLQAMIALGFNLHHAPVHDFWMLDQIVAAGQKACLSPGLFHPNGEFDTPDEFVRSRLRLMTQAQKAAIASIYVSDEPDLTVKAAYDKHAARIAMLHQELPGVPCIIEHWSADNLTLAGQIADQLWLAAYPCRNDGYHLDYVPVVASRADSTGKPYIGIVQTHGGTQTDPIDGAYVRPTAQQVHEMFAEWRKTKAVGISVFAWDYPQDRADSWMTNHPELMDAVKAELAT